MLIEMSHIHASILKILAFGFHKASYRIIPLISIGKGKGIGAFLPLIKKEVR
jgi:hypothetical protein